MMDAAITVTFVGSEMDTEGRTGAAEPIDTPMRAKVRKDNNIQSVDANM